ncbi:MAG TPA: ABC transporter ATP-binding protein [Chloroflexota bacterium]|nr:ABC transporter ATP-binding protein [Chloroflexota bacterium]
MVAPDVELIGVTKRFGDVLAVRGVSVAVARGEFLTLLGPSGCGKTTTLNVIAGFLRPDEGQVLLGGRRVEHLPPYRRDTAMVFQQYALFPHMTVAGNIAFGLQMRKVPSSEIGRRVDRVLEIVRLPGLGARRPSQLSGGQQQRVALARAIVTEPTVLLLDEPLSNLDLKLRESLRLEIKRIQRELGITAVYVTHDQGEALVMSDRIAVMDQGVIEQVGPPAEIYEQPRTPFVAEFIGTSNFLRGRLASVENKLARVILRDGTELWARQPDAGQRGEDVLLMIRPEHLRAARGEAHGPGTDRNELRAKVTDVVYLGSYIRYAAEVSSGEAVTVEEQNVPGAARCASGELVTLEVAPEHCLLLWEG